jgi:hypothetical protein
MVQNSSMRLDHVSYVTSHDQLSDTVQRLGSLLGSAFIDGGIHPRFGTRNFTASLKNGQYIEVVCPLDHPATEQTPWGKAVSRKVNEGGGWFTWVFSTKDISPIALKFGRQAIEGHRTRPNGTDLKWKQIGVKEISETPELPFFIEWLTPEHPSQDGTPHAQITKIAIADSNQLSNSWFKDEILNSIDEVTLEWVEPSSNYDQNGIVSINFRTAKGEVIIE